MESNQVEEGLKVKKAEEVSDCPEIQNKNEV